MVYLTNMASLGGEHSSWQIFHDWFGQSRSAYSRSRYVGKPSASGATEREQTALGADEIAERHAAVRNAAAATAGPKFPARVNDGCPHCPLKRTCPALTGECP